VSAKAEDLTGRTFGNLTALRMLDERGARGEVMWACRCVCGQETTVRAGFLKSGHSSSCGCMNQSKKKRAQNLSQSILEELRAAGADGMTMPELFLEFSEFDYKSVVATVSKLRQVYNIKMVPEGRASTGNLIYRYTLLPPKKFEIK
jgi:hypothetical protein